MMKVMRLMRSQKLTTKHKADIAGISTLMSEVPKPGGRKAKTSGKGPNNTLLQETPIPLKIVTNTPKDLTIPFSLSDIQDVASSLGDQIKLLTN